MHKILVERVICHRRPTREIAYMELAFIDYYYRSSAGSHPIPSRRIAIARFLDS